MTDCQKKPVTALGQQESRVSVRFFLERTAEEGAAAQEEG